jgi:hypothetical protein
MGAMRRACARHQYFITHSLFIDYASAMEGWE